MGSNDTARAAILVLAQILALTGPAAAGCQPDTAELRWSGGAARFRVEIADTAAEREKGLMFREKLSASAGMLFVYDAPEHAYYWMKNTLIPLDIVFVNSAGTVTRIAADAVPGDETALDGGEGVRYVLEINGGMAKRLGLAEGAQLRNDAMVQAGLDWPCSAD